MDNISSNVENGCSIFNSEQIDDDNQIYQVPGGKKYYSLHAISQSNCACHAKRAGFPPSEYVKPHNSGTIYSFLTAKYDTVHFALNLQDIHPCKLAS